MILATVATALTLATLHATGTFLIGVALLLIALVLWLAAFGRRSAPS